LTSASAAEHTSFLTSRPRPSSCQRPESSRLGNVCFGPGEVTNLMVCYASQLECSQILRIETECLGTLHDGCGIITFQAECYGSTAVGFRVGRLNAEYPRISCQSHVVITLPAERTSHIQVNTGRLKGSELKGGSIIRQGLVILAELVVDGAPILVS